jgi:hypothetical protein
MDSVREKKKEKKASYLHRTAQPPTLAVFQPWGSSAGAGRIRLAGRKYSLAVRCHKIKSDYSGNTNL